MLYISFWNCVFTEIDKESCGDPGTPLYGIREGDSFSNGGILRFECQFGFELIGEKTISCQDNNQWSANIPICICKYSNHSVGEFQACGFKGEKACSAVMLITVWPVTMVTVQSLLWPGAYDDRWCCGDEYLTENFFLCTPPVFGSIYPSVCLSAFL